MTWQEVDAVELRSKFIQEYELKKSSFSTLCRKYEISRKTGYKWLRRYEQEGLTGLENRSKCPARLHITDSEWVERILQVKEQFPAWGARKLRQHLINEGLENPPSESTFNRTLRRHNMIDEVESSKRKPFIRFERPEPMELLQMDFKGHFPVYQGRCHPLTVIDDHSRFALCLKSCGTESYEVVRNALTDAFREYGLPEAMTMDNGSPWKGSPPFVLSRLTVWLMRLGIKVSHSRPRHPQTQGKDERFHRTLKDELLRFNNFQSLEEAQIAFDEWRKLYNYTRPHEGIGMKRPFERFRASSRLFPEKLPQIEYSEDDQVRKVQRNGVIDFKGYQIFVGEHLQQEYVAVRETKLDGHYDVYFHKTRIKGTCLKGKLRT